ncbi:hypothetical protein O6R05_00055 [Peptoniphilus equinus]|uniref:ORC1/DEAH AAA+ ATPase domain-containing protein n=1 Tax=Peptoniphilus equinus TaxID=3016343 RepID=A0ABY7QUG2_9FIRM|nr:AAA family ATPase [Peptoniphilus equinus]WBW49996.1 hypothetical protein O6R05_00055 [Peptoniphilus equinus]
MVLQIHLFGRTEIFLNGKKIHFSYQKAMVLLLILSDKKSYHRHKICQLLWPDKTEKSANNNLRSCIYALKKVLGPSSIISETNSYIKLNDTIEVISDMDQINHCNGTQFEDIHKLHDFIGYYSQEILSDLKFPFSYDLEEYLENLIKKHYDCLYWKADAFLNQFIQDNLPECIIAISEFMIQFNVYNKKPYIELIKAYNTLGNYTQSTAVKQQFKDIFYHSRDPFISKIPPIKNSFYREEEIACILEAIVNFQNNKDVTNILIDGAVGSGKSEILQALFNELDSKMPVIRITISNLYKASDHEVFDRLCSELDNHMLCDVSKNHVKLHDNKKLVLLIDNFDRCDALSLQKIIKFLVNNHESILLIATQNKLQNKEFEYFIQYLVIEGFVTRVELKNLTRETLSKIFTKDNSEDLDELYLKTGGNPFLINYVTETNISKEMYEAYMTILLDCKDPLEKEILDILCLSNDPLTIKNLSEILNEKDTDIVYSISLLLERQVIQSEGADSERTFCIGNSLQKDYLSSRINEAKKDRLYYLLAEYYVTKLYNNYFLDEKTYGKIINYFEKAHDYTKSFLYQYKQFIDQYHVSHEFFPVAYEDEYTHQINTDKKLFDRTYNKLLAILDTLPEKYEMTFQKARIELLFCNVRFHKSIGDNEDTEHKLSAMLKLSQSIHYFEGIFNAKVQYIQHYINTEDNLQLKNAVDSLGQLKVYMGSVQKAVYLRLKAYQLALSGDYDSALSTINDALTIFRNQTDIYKMRFNIIACYFIMGEIYFLQDKWDEAFDYYLEAMSNNFEKQVHPSLGLLYSKLGAICIRQSRLQEAAYYLKKSAYQYEHTGFLWGRKGLETYLAELKVYQN